MTPTSLAAAATAAVALAVLVVPLPLAGIALAALAAAVLVDGRLARRPVELRRALPPVLARGRAAAYLLEPLPSSAGLALRLRQPLSPDLVLEPQEGDGRLESRLVARRRGRHVLPRPAVRVSGPLRLAFSQRRVLADEEVLVYPDLPRARRLALAVRRGNLRETGWRGRGPLGLGTELESVRDYLPDDDIRHVNWAATARLGRPMSNTYRVEQDRDVVCVVDAGRLMGAPLRDRTRLDAALDAVAAVAAVADEIGDRCGAIAFDDGIRRQVRAGRKGAGAVVQALFDLEPRPVDADYELAFRTVGGVRRALVVVFTDLLEEAAARPLAAAVPMLARRHAVLVATASDPDLAGAVSTEPSSPRDVYVAAAALDVLAARARVAATLAGAGARVVEAPPDQLPEACVRAYLRAKARARV